MSLAFTIGALCALPGFFFRLAWCGRWKRNAGPSGFTQANRDGLLRGTSTVLAASHMLNLFMHKFSSCGGGRFTFPQILLGAFDRCFRGHTPLLFEALSYYRCYLSPKRWRT